jgi:hypothetical protein
MTHYIYYSYEPWGRGYIGSRSCLCLPEEDCNYFGSFYDKTFAPKEKIILQVFETREEALNAEIILHDFYRVDLNPHFANKARQTSTKFISCGKRSNEFRKKISAINKGKKLSPEHIKKVSDARSKALKGRKLNKEHKRKISEALKGKRKGVKIGKRLTKESRQIRLVYVETGEIFAFPSISRASEATGIKRANLYHMIKNPHLLGKGYKLVSLDS